MPMGMIYRQDHAPQPTRESALRAPRAPRPAATYEAVGLAKALQIFRSNWHMVILPVLMALALAVAYLVITPAQYTSTALLYVDVKPRTGLSNGPQIVSDVNVESANIESQVELLKSERIVRQIIEQQQLADSPTLAPSPFASALRWLSATVKFWQPQPVNSESRRIAAATLALERLTSIRRIGLTYAVELSVTMPDADQAARIANAYAQAFIEDQTRLREDVARRSSALLEARTKALRTQADQASRAVEAFKFSGSPEGENSASARVTLQDLESTAETYRTLYDKFLERYAETWQQQFLSVPDVQLASAAYPPLTKSAPKGLAILAAAAFLGFVIGYARVAAKDSRVLGLSPPSAAQF
jgi:uncharacterized protein involved in exopolysaccharide biosynthesis